MQLNVVWSAADTFLRLRLKFAFMGLLASKKAP